MIKAIETRYSGYLFRSRLEARWAVFWDALGLKWEYEPEGFNLPSGGYLPDFKVKYPGRDSSERHHRWFEVKGDLHDVTQSDWARMLEFESAIGAQLFVLDGIPDARMYCSVQELLVCNFDDYRVPIQPFVLNTDVMNPERFGCALWSGKGRLWWDDRANFFDGGLDPDGVIRQAAQAARSARFEHGEVGFSRAPA